MRFGTNATAIPACVVSVLGSIGWIWACVPRSDLAVPSLSPPEYTARAAPASRSETPASCDTFYLSPTDFNRGSATVDLLPPANGRSFLVIVPQAGDARREDGVHRKPPAPTVSVQVTPSFLDVDTTRHRLPDLPRLTDEVTVQSRPRVTTALPTIERIRMSTSRNTWITVVGTQAYSDQSYVFYDDILNTENFSRDEYMAIARTVSRWQEWVDERFAPPTDLDANGHVLVFVSRTAAQVSRSTLWGWVDTCDKDLQSEECGDRTAREAIFVRSLDTIVDAKKRRDYYVNEFFPGLLLHETIHLSQLAIARSFGARAGDIKPLYREGQAELGFLATGLALDEQSAAIRNALRKDAATSDAFTQEYPYQIGGLFLWWLDQKLGGRVHGALLKSTFSGHASDPFLGAIGVPEPLGLAMMYASISLEEASGRCGAWLRRPVAVNRLPGSKLPVSVIAPGQWVMREVPDTGYLILDVRHREHVQVAVETGEQGAFLVVVQP